MTKELRNTLEYCFRNIDKASTEQLAKLINPHVAEIRRIVEEELKDIGA